MLFIHELGHYIVGRRLGFNVVEFSIFMGPRLFSFERKGIRYSLKAIPLGASVEFAGEYPDEQDTITLNQLEKGDFYERPKRYRAFVLLAGPLMNIMTAFLAFFILFNIVGYASTTVGAVQDNSLASQANILPEERLLEVNGYKINTDMDFVIAEMTIDENEPYTIVTVNPGTGEEKTSTITPQTTTSYVAGISVDTRSGDISIAATDTAVNPDANKFVLGDQILEINNIPVTIENFIPTLRQEAGPEATSFLVRRGDGEVLIDVNTKAVQTPMQLGISLAKAEGDLLETLPYTFQYMWSYLKGTGTILGRVFQGRERAQDAVTGPVGIVNMFSGVVTSDYDIGLKLAQVLNLFAVISLALGATNLLPIPPLDGGQLLILGLEGIRGKRLSIKAQTAVTLIGIVFVLLLAVLAFSFDIQRIFFS